MEIRALQPQRELSPTTELFIGARESCEVTITAKIFADTLPEPVVQELQLKLEVGNILVKATDVINEVILPTTDVELQAGKH